MTDTLDKAAEQTAPADASSTKPAKTRGTSPRSRAREFAVQAVYQLLVGKNDVSAVDAFTRDLTGFNKANVEHYDAIVYGVAREASRLDELITPYLDRPWQEISPVEHAIMRLGVYEYQFCQDVPWRVVLNEYIELTKTFGGTDGHKYVNGVLHKLGGHIRPTEIDQRNIKA